MLAMTGSVLGNDVWRRGLYFLARKGALQKNCREFRLPRRAVKLQALDWIRQE